MKTSLKTGPHSRVSFRQSELALVIGALAETLDEQRTPHSGPDCRRIARLHSRLLAVFHGEPRPTDPDYAVRSDGAVVAARDAHCVVAPAHGLAQMLRQMAPAR